jgi:hypothetical protein
MEVLSLRLSTRKRRMFGPIVFFDRSAAIWLAVDALPPLPNVNTCFSLRYARKSISPSVARSLAGSSSIVAWSRFR